MSQLLLALPTAIQISALFRDWQVANNTGVKFQLPQVYSLWREVSKWFGLFGLRRCNCRSCYFQLVEACCIHTHCEFIRIKFVTKFVPKVPLVVVEHTWTMHSLQEHGQIICRVYCVWRNRGAEDGFTWASWWVSMLVYFSHYPDSSEVLRCRFSIYNAENILRRAFVAGILVKLSSLWCDKGDEKESVWASSE